MYQANRVIGRKRSSKNEKKKIIAYKVILLSSECCHFPFLLRFPPPNAISSCHLSFYLAINKYAVANSSHNTVLCPNPFPHSHLCHSIWIHIEIFSNVILCLWCVLRSPASTTVICYHYFFLSFSLVFVLSLLAFGCFYHFPEYFVGDDVSARRKNIWWYNIMNVIYDLLDCWVLPKEFRSNFFNCLPS